MAPTTTTTTTPDDEEQLVAAAADDDGPIARVLALPEMWTKFAELGCWNFVEFWRLTSLCTASRVGLKLASWERACRAW